MYKEKKKEIMEEKFLEDLLKSCSLSGYEGPGLRVFKEYCEKWGGSLVYTDKIGNTGYGDLRRGGGDDLIMLSAHIDEIGYQVVHVTDSGMLTLSKIGGPDLKVMLGSEVWVGPNKVPGVIGKIPIHLEEDRKSLSLKISDLLVDVGAESKEEVEEMGIRIGNRVGFLPNYKKLGPNRIMSKGLDDKIGVYIVAEATKRLLGSYSLTGVVGVATTQEEEGLRGATICSKNINPDISIDIDVTFATDEGRSGINVLEKGDIKLGKGPVIMCGPDKSERLVDIMYGIAKKHKIPYQLGVSRSGGTNTCVIQEEARDCETALLSIPNRNMHTGVEVCDMRDVQAAIDLLVETVKHLKS